MANVDISFKEALIINKSLLATVERLEKEAEKTENENFNKKVAASILREFLLDNHPELTSKLAEFTMAYVKNNGYDKDNIAGGGLEALSYHNDMIEDEVLRRTVTELEKING